LDPDLLPAQIEAVGAAAVALHGAATEPRLDRGDVVDAHRPAEPSAAGVGAGTYGLAERRLASSRVIEHLDRLEGAAVLEWQDDVARSERRLQPTVGERRPKACAQPLNARCQPLRAGGVREVVESHAAIVDHTYSPSAWGLVAVTVGLVLT